MTIPVSRLTKRWVKEPGFKTGYDALEAEFAIASILIEARTKAHEPDSRSRRRRPRKAA